MKEDLIQFIWKSKYLFSSKLITTNGESLEIIHPGNFNTNQGPDFLQAKIRINDILWVGHVEIHVMASEWIVHNHQDDPNYQNTILHVVWYEDKKINWSGRIIPCIELKSLVHEDILRNYQMLMDNRHIISCQPIVSEISALVKSAQIERMMFERLEEKTEKCKEELSAMQWDWEAILFRKIAHYLVAPINCEAMEQLCEKTSYSLIAKHSHDSFQLSALLFGMSGLLHGRENDEYCISLIKEFEFLKTKFQLNPMQGFEWKLLRLRPSHFPGLRIAQLVCLYSNKSRLFSKILDARGISELNDLLEIEMPEYWEDHYNPGKKSAGTRKPSIGRQTKEIIIINAICPLMFAYGLIYSMNAVMDQAVGYLQKIKPEVNHITHMWKNFNFVLDHAGHSQGGIQLFQKYCLEKKCTSCSIGNEILKSHRRESL